MLKTIENQTLALAGVFQAASLVRSVAQRGREITPAVTASIHSLFKIDANSVEDIFNGTSGLREGLTTMLDQLAPKNSQQRDIEVTRYAVTLIYLERKLRKKTVLMAKLSKGIQGAVSQASYFSETHSNVIANLADLYRQTLSTLSPKILVHGDPQILSNPENANLVRALLLAGIRSVILWRQCGGNRIQLLFGRRKLLQFAQHLSSTLM